jgi:plastocyanin
MVKHPVRSVLQVVLGATLLATAPALPGRAAAALYAQNSGTIEGTVSLTPRPARRTLNRYAGSGSAAARTLQDVSLVVWIEGAFPGVRATATPARAEVAQLDTAFAPGALVVPVGTPVAFPNRDAIFHNVFSFSPAKRFDLGRYPRGESKTVVFDKVGAIKVYCEVHQFMRAAIIVVENPFHSLVGPDGRFTLRNVPAGTHRLIVWDIERGQQEVEVTVTTGSITRLQVTVP